MSCVPERLTRHVGLSVPCFTGALCMLAIVVAVSCTMSISELYAMRGTDLMAVTTATAMATTAHYRVDSFMNQAFVDADGIQFMTVMSGKMLPSDGMAAGKYTNLTWSTEYLSLCGMLMRGSEFKYSSISFSFEDGFAALCQRGVGADTFETLSSTYLPKTDVSSTAISTYSNNGTFVSKVTTDESYDARERSWYRLVPQEPMAKQWFPVGFVGLTPAASMVASISNSTNHFLGGISLSFSIESLSSLLMQAKPMISSEILLLDEKLAVIGSTLPTPTSVNRPVSNNYHMTDLEEAEGCILSDTGAETDYALLVCHQSIRSYGYEPLRRVSESHANILDDMDNLINVERVRVGTTNYYVSVTSLTYGIPNAWRIICFLPEDELTASVIAGRSIVIWVTVGIVVLVVTLSAIAAKLLLRPLSRIATLMGSAAYLSSQRGSPSGDDAETDSDETTDAAKHDHERWRRAEEAQKELLKERTLSFWSDVRSIQLAYWAMADQLGELQGYIPEHVREEIVGQHLRPAENGGSFGHNSAHRDEREMAIIGEGSALNTSDTPRLNFDTLRTASNGIPDIHVEAVPLPTVSTVPSGAVTNGEFSSIVPPNHTLVHITAPAPIPSAVALSTHAGEAETLCSETFDDVSVAAARIAGVGDNMPIPIVFGDNVLVDRDITVVHINILQFHMYAQATHGRTITEEHGTIVNYIHAAARRCGGNLETFMGDKFWISFNATSKCLDSQVAAACLAYEVTCVMNKDALEGQHRRRINYERRVQNLPPLAKDAHPRHRFKAAPSGVSCGIATGRAFVGPLGTKAIKRHSIISNAFTEASALERLSLRYPGCAVMIGGDMIPAIEGYFQYLILDASLLPGSGGKRRRVASLKGPMLAPGRNPDLHRGSIRKEMPFKHESAYKGVNDCFNAFLEGRLSDCAATLREVDVLTTAAAAELATKLNDAGHDRDDVAVVPSGREDRVDDSNSTATASSNAYVSTDIEEQCAEIGLMSRLLWSILTAPSPVDGRAYRSPFGEMYTPMAHALRLVVKGADTQPSQAEGQPASSGHSAY